MLTEKEQEKKNIERKLVQSSNFIEQYKKNEKELVVELEEKQEEII